ncbi:hypothetical protein Tco_0883664 [Tanacetum coccineum]
MDEGTQNNSFDHLSASTNPNFLVDKIQSASEGLETVLTTPKTRNRASTIAKQIEEVSLGGDEFTSSDEISKKIKLEDLSKLVQNVKANFKDLDSLEDEPIIMVDESEDDEEDKDEEVHATSNLKTKGTSAHKPPSLSSLPTELKDISSKFNDLIEEVKGLKKHVHELEIELLWDLKEIPTKLEDFTTIMSNLITQVAELNILQWELLAKFLFVPIQFAHAIASTSKKTKDAIVPSAGQAGTQPVEDKVKKAMSSKGVEEESSDSESDDTINLIISRVESSRMKKLNNFDFVSKDGDHVHLTKEQIKEQNRIKESTKGEAAKHEVEVRKEELVDLLDPDVVSKYYKAKLQYDKYCEKMLNR